MVILELIYYIVCVQNPAGTTLNAQLTIGEECIDMPGVEVSSLIGGDPSSDSLIQDDRGSSLTNLELDSNGSGPIFVFTDPSQLAALKVSVISPKGKHWIVTISHQVWFSLMCSHNH